MKYHVHFKDWLKLYQTNTQKYIEYVINDHYS